MGPACSATSIGRAYALRLEWLPKANTTRFAQLDYIAQHNAKAAISMDEQIEKQTEQLLHYPEMGRPGRKKGTRELVIAGTPFIAIYRVKPRAGRIELLCVLHGARQYP